MKILVVSNLYPPFNVGGYELLCADIMEGLKKKGHNVHVLTSTYGVGSPFTQGDISRVLLVNGELNAKWYGILPLFFVQIKNALKLIRLIRSFQPDCILACNLRGYSNYFVSVLCSQSVPVIFYVSDESLLGLMKGSDPWVKWWVSTSLPYRSKILRRIMEILGFKKVIHRFCSTSSESINAGLSVFTSDFLRQRFKEEGLSVKNSQVVYCGIPLPESQQGSQKISSTPFRLLYVGRVVQEKGIETVIQALPYVIKRKPNHPISLSIIGPGSPQYLESLHELVLKLGLSSLVQLKPPLPRDKIYEEYQRHHAFVLPSIWNEPFALTPLEAMANGLPVIGTLTGGSKELFRDGENSLTFVAGDPLDLSEKVLELLEKPQLFCRLQAFGPEYIRQRFSREKMVDEVEGYLNNVALGTLAKAVNK